MRDAEQRRDDRDVDGREPFAEEPGASRVSDAIDYHAHGNAKHLSSGMADGREAMAPSIEPLSRTTDNDVVVARSDGDVTKAEDPAASEKDLFDDFRHDNEAHPRSLVDTVDDAHTSSARTMRGREDDRMRHDVADNTAPHIAQLSSSSNASVYATMQRVEDVVSNDAPAAVSSATTEALGLASIYKGHLIK